MVGVDRGGGGPCTAVLLVNEGPCVGLGLGGICGWLVECACMRVEADIK